MPLIRYPNQFDEELMDVMKYIDNLQEGNYIDPQNFSNPFLAQVARMAIAHSLYKNKMLDDALDAMDTVVADDWKQAGKQWLERRYVRR
jgi:hypothetical protein